MRDWRLDELSTVGVEHLDESFVAGYDQKAGYDPADDVAVLLDHGLGRSDTAVDLGAGTGSFATAIAEHVEQVMAVDPSPVMVAAIRRRTEHQPNVIVSHSGFLTWSAEPSSVAAVFTRNALHHLPDFWKVMALRRIETALQPGGLLRLRDLVFAHAPSDVEDAVEAWLESAGNDPAHGYTPAELAAHLRQEFSTFTWLLEPMLERCGFDILDTQTNAGIYMSYTCRKAES